MVSTLKSAGTLSAPGSVDQTENALPGGVRAEIARQAVADIFEVIGVLERYNPDGALAYSVPRMNPVVLMVTERVKQLASGALSALDDDDESVPSIEARTWPPLAAVGVMGGAQ